MCEKLQNTGFNEYMSQLINIKEACDEYRMKQEYSRYTLTFVSEDYNFNASASVLEAQKQ